MKQNIIETIVGFVVIIVAIVFLTYTYSRSNKTLTSEDGYLLNARFQNVEGISKGSDIMLAGIKVGSVESLKLDHASFVATVKLRIDQNIKLPKDSQASIVTSGFLGGKFITLTPGGSDEDLSENDQIKYTQSSVNIESLVGKLIYSFTNK